MMRRNTSRCAKLLVVTLVTILLTVVTYKLFFKDDLDDELSAVSNDNLVGFVDHLRGEAVDIHSADVPSAVDRAKSDGNFFRQGSMVESRNVIDWHDYAYIETERKRHGLGEHGVAAKLSAELEPKRQALFDKNGFNGLLSDLISVNRSVADIRHKG